jgi:hypothetical protein
MSQETNEPVSKDPANARDRRRRELDLDDFASGARIARIVCYCIALALLLVGLVLFYRVR